MSLLDSYSVPEDHIAIQPGWAYIDQPYTGIIFEIRIGEGDRLATGGPAMGFACDVLQLVEVCARTSDIHTHIVNLVSGNNTEKVAAMWAQALRARGIAVALMNAANTRSKTALVVREDGSLQFGQQFYTMEQIDFLMITLSGLTGR